MGRGSAQPKNHPKKGSSTVVGPIRQLKDIKAIKRLLSDHPRNFAIFTVGVNTALRASDLARLTISQVKYLRPGDHFLIREFKTKKDRMVTVNQEVHTAVQKLLSTMPEAKDSDYLFPSRVKKGNGHMTTGWLNNLVKSWCKEINLNGENYGSHTLRKTFGYQQRVQHGVSTALLQEIFMHSSAKVTTRYLGIQEDEIKTVYMNVI